LTTGVKQQGNKDGGHRTQSTPFSATIRRIRKALRGSRWRVHGGRSVLWGCLPPAPLDHRSARGRSATTGPRSPTPYYSGLMVAALSASGGAARSVRLLCFPSAGSGTAAFRGWSDLLPLFVEVVPVELPGRGRRATEPACRRMNDLVDDVFDQVISDTAADIALFGHSMGALVAFEVARELRRRREPAPIGLFVSSHRAPHLTTDDLVPPSSLNDDALVALARSLGGTPDILFDEPDAVRYFLPILRADCELVDSYQLIDEDPLDIPLIAFGGNDDPTVSGNQLRAWNVHTAAEFSCHTYSGGHFYYSNKLDEMLRAVSDVLVERIKWNEERVV
jgi:medium-chain acyl-[acyl-carrier-protein] hydrolase